MKKMYIVAVLIDGNSEIELYRREAVNDYAAAYSILEDNEKATFDRYVEGLQEKSDEDYEPSPDDEDKSPPQVSASDAKMEDLQEFLEADNSFLTVEAL